MRVGGSKKVAADAASRSTKDAEADKRELDRFLNSIRTAGATWKDFLELLPGSLTNGKTSAAQTDVQLETEGSEGSVDTAPVQHKSSKDASKSTALIPVVNGLVPFVKPSEVRYAFARSEYIIPHDLIEAWPVATNKISAEALSALRENRSPQAWGPYLHPETMGIVKGKAAEEDEEPLMRNLFTTFHVVNNKGEVMEELSAHIVLVSSAIAKVTTTEFMAKAGGYDFTTDAGRLIQENILGFFDNHGMPKKLSDKVNKSLWKVVPGTYTSPLPKTPKAPRQNKPSANDPSVETEKRKLSHMEVEVDCKTTMFLEDEDEDQPELIEWVKRVKVGKSYSVVTDGVPNGHVLIVKYRERA